MSINNMVIELFSLYSFLHSKVSQNHDMYENTKDFDK